MSTTIKLRRSAVPGRVPTTGQLELGELAINTADGKLYFKRYDPVANTESIVDVSADLDASAILSLLSGVDGANSGLDADLLDGQQGSYYLDYNNFTNVPPATLDLTLTGKVTGNAFSNTGIMTLVTELANTGVVAGTYGSASLVPVLVIDEDGRITSANTVSVAGVSNTFWTVANNTFTIETADGGVYDTLITEFSNITSQELTVNGDTTLNGNVDIEETITANNIVIYDHIIAGRLSVIGDIDTPSSTDSGNLIANNATIEHLTVNNNIIVNGLVDGRDIAADGAKLDLLEDGLDLTLTGKVTGFASSNTGVMVLTTELANTGVTSGVYGSSTAIPVITVDEDGRITLANTASVAGVNDFYWTSANNTLTLETGDGSSYLVPIDTFTNITVNDLTANNIIVSGLVDGRDIAVDGAKLDGIEAGATGDQTASEILALLLTVDGDGSGLDADLIDGYSASEILDAAANTAASLVGAGEVFIYANTGVVVTGDSNFNLNSSNTFIIEVAHEDTSSVSDVSNSNGNVINGLTFDTFGHVQTVSSLDLDTRYYTETELDNGQLNNLYYTETELDNGQLDNRYFTETELNNGQLDTRYYTETELDNGQLDNRYYTETELDNGQLDNRYYTETELDNGQLDNRYYTETEADNKFVDVTGDTMSGDLTVNATIHQQYSSHINYQATTATFTQTSIYAFPHATYGSAEIIITAIDGSNRHISKFLITHDGSTAIATEYGTVYTSSELAQYEVEINGPALQILAAPSTNSTITYNIVGTLINA